MDTHKNQEGIKELCTTKKKKVEFIASFSLELDGDAKTKQAEM